MTATLPRHPTDIGSGLRRWLAQDGHREYKHLVPPIVRSTCTIGKEKEGHPWVAFDESQTSDASA